MRTQDDARREIAATYADGKLTTGYIYLDSNPPEGSVRVTTAGGSATYEVVYDHH